MDEAMQRLGAKSRRMTARGASPTCSVSRIGSAYRSGSATWIAFSNCLVETGARTPITCPPFLTATAPPLSWGLHRQAITF